MTRRMRRVAVGALLTLITLCHAGPASAQSDAAELPVPSDHLQVVTTELEPFIVREGDRPSGFYWEIWEDVAGEMQVSYDITWVDNFDDLIDAIEDGSADVAVAPLAPTAAREARVDFSSAVITSGPQLGLHERAASTASLLAALVGSRVVRLILLALAGLVLLGHAIWLVERHDEDNDFHPTYLRGVWDGVWWAAATVTTVGYGDKAPTSTRGRVIAMFAMLASLFLVGAFVSEVSRDFAAQQEDQGIVAVEDLDGRAVAVVDGSTFGSYLDQQGANTLAFETQADVFDAVADGKANVLVASPFAIATLGDEHRVAATGTVLYHEFETFGLGQESPWREPINGALADLQSSGNVQATIDRWLKN